MTPQSLFITGTDTGVGKTIVTSLVALHFMRQGADVGVMKPIASGCETIDGTLINEDAAWLQQVTGVRDEMDLINPVRYAEPLAPLTAARRNGETTADVLQRCADAYAELQRRHEIVIVEGVGGWLVPLAHHKSTFATCADLVKLLDLPVIIACRRILGTINHSLLTCAQIPRQRQVGLFFCDATPVAPNDVAAQTSPTLISEISGLPILAQIPFLESLSIEKLQAQAELLFPL